MFCNYCKSARPENEAPCPNCGAPSSLLGQFQGGNQGTGEPVSTAWSASATSFNQQWNTNQVPQFSPSYAEPSWQQKASSQPLPVPQQQWGMPIQDQSPQQQWGMPTQNQSPNQPSMLPVPYNGNAQEGNQQTPMQMVPFQQMVPALPDEQAETVYVPPMYTKPRPIIPRYRIISGMLSVIIVSLFLCGGGVYYAQANGALTNVERMVGAVRPANIGVSAAHNIPDPPLQSAVPGPASNIITGATTTLHIIGNMPREQDTIIPVGTSFYVTFSAKPPKNGNIMVKWYMNGQYYKTTPSQKAIDPKQDPTVNGFVTMTYIVPATGIAELYWVGQGETPKLGQRLYFSVK